MSTKRWVALGAAGVLFFVSIMINLASLAFSTNFDEAFSAMDTTEGLPEVILEPGSTSDRIAVIDLNGTIQDTGDDAGLFGATGYNHTHFMNQLEQVKEDDSISAIVLSVNTPGGGVVESAQIHDKLVEIKEEAGKTIYVSMGAQATSGGYYVAAPADKIFASKETMTGSLGVIMQTINYGELAENFGIEFVTITSGEFKDMLSPTEKTYQIKMVGFVF